MVLMQCEPESANCNFSKGEFWRAQSKQFNIGYMYIMTEHGQGYKSFVKGFAIVLQLVNS